MLPQFDDTPRWFCLLPPDWVEGFAIDVVREAQAAYRAPGRKYHAWPHVLACIDALHGMPCDKPRNVFLALLFHDAVYVPGGRDNEVRSADLAVAILRGHSSVPEADLQAIHDLIIATRDHKVAPGETSRDVAAVVDIDMSILGAPWEAYSAYADGVRDEYCPAVVSKARFRAGRVVFLGNLLASEAIFHTAEGKARWEAAARSNVARELSDHKSRQGLLERAVTAVVAMTHR